MSLQQGIQTVGNALKGIGFDPTVNQLPDSNGAGWAVPAKKNILFVTVSDTNGYSALNITSPMLFMPVRDLLPFYRKMLDLNSKMIGASLAMDRDIVCLISHQALDGLPQSTVETIIQINRELADALSEGLWAEFPGARFWQ